jgi:hypothetical protein
MYCAKSERRKGIGALTFVLIFSGNVMRKYVVELGRKFSKNEKKKKNRVRELMERALIITGRP